jgi:branched-chain amino acid transport system ATP-binding protein
LMIMDEGLVATGLRAGYGDVTALWSLDLHVWPEQVTALLGRNGAGKTTALNALAGLLSARSGTVVLNGEDVTGVPCYDRVKRGISLVQEGRRIFGKKTVEENLRLGAYARRLSRSELAEALEAAYWRFPILRERRRSIASSLSGGQQEMLAIAQALVAQPRILMLDEPTAGLAPAICDDVFDTVRSLADEGIGVLLVDQQIERVLQLADHAHLLELGRVVSGADEMMCSYQRAPDGAGDGGTRPQAGLDGQQ